MKIPIETSTLVGGSLTRLVSPPDGLKALDRLAWMIGRDDALRGVQKAIRCSVYRKGKKAMYIRGYNAQVRANTKLRRAGHLSNDKQKGATPRRLE